MAGIDATEEVYKYGWVRVNYRILQAMNKPSVLVISLCCSAFLNGAAAEVLSVMTTSIERHFGFTPSEISIFFIAYKVATGISCFIVGFKGSNHKPRFIAGGQFLMVFACLLLMLPKFIYVPYNAGEAHNENIFCTTNNTVKNKSSWW